MGSWFRALVLTTGVFGLLACSSSTKQPLDKQLDALRVDVTRLQMQQNHLQQQLGALQVARPNPGAGARENQGQTARPALDVTVLQPRKDPKMNEGSAELRTDDNARAINFDTDVERDALQAKNSEAPWVEANKQYEKNIALARRKQYEQAIQGFTGLLVRYPDFARADNVLYWIGECYYQKGEGPRAMEPWEGLLARFPESKKIPGVLSKLAPLYQEQGQEDKAREALHRLRAHYPASAAAHRASALTTE